MPQQVDSAQRVRICKIDESLDDQKIRVAGRVLCYDGQSGFLVLMNEKNALLVDVSLALDEKAGTWATERMSKVMVIGRIERVITGEIQEPEMPAHAARLTMNHNLVLRALLITNVDDLDLKLWDSVLEEEEEEETKTKEE